MNFIALVHYQYKMRFRSASGGDKWDNYLDIGSLELQHCMPLETRPRKEKDLGRDTAVDWAYLGNTMSDTAARYIALWDELIMNCLSTLVSVTTQSESHSQACYSCVRCSLLNAWYGGAKTTLWRQK